LPVLVPRGPCGWRTLLRFEVEQKSIDVAIFLAASSNDDRFVFNIPVLIIETKRPEVELTEDVDEQLKTYMKRERCRAGLSFNAREAVWLSVRGEFTLGCWDRERMSDLQDVEHRIKQATRTAMITSLNYKNASTSAAAGDYDLLLNLISIIGQDSRLTFTLSIRIRGNLSSVQAFAIRRVNTDDISYWTRGVVSKKRQMIGRHEFHSLIAVRPV
jgi:hypothetical protein